MRRLHRKNRGAYLGGLPGFHSEYNVLEQPNEIMYFHWSEAHCGLVVVKLQKCEILIKKKYRKSSEILRFRNFSGGDKRDRTADLLNAIQALSQLSYTPKFFLFAVLSPDSFCIIAHQANLSIVFLKKFCFFVGAERIGKNAGNPLPFF